MSSIFNLENSEVILWVRMAEEEEGRPGRVVVEQRGGISTLMTRLPLSGDESVVAMTSHLMPAKAVVLPMRMRAEESAEVMALREMLAGRQRWKGRPSGRTVVTGEEIGGCDWQS